MARATSSFVIAEQRTDGETGERFEWLSGPRPGTFGGARAMPKQAWHLAGKLHTVRTDYPGARLPSEQVLGPRHEPFTLSGRWDDRYNGHGYALSERTRFEAMCRRGNVVLITFEEERWQGLVTEWDFEYRRRDWIGYSFTFSNHGRPGGDKPPPAPPEIRSPAETFDRVLLAAQALLDTQRTRPAPAMKTDASASSTTLFAEHGRTGVEYWLGSVSAKINAFGDQLTGVNSKARRPLTTFRRLATQLRMIQGDTQSLLNALTAVRSDTELSVRTAAAVLDWETYSRSMREQARLLLHEVFSGARQMEEHAHGPAARLYRPFRGESLYGISRRFYGTPHAWHLIADRNGLVTMKLQGTELLVIPDRGEG